MNKSQKKRLKYSIIHGLSLYYGYKSNKHNPLAIDKSRQIISELQSFFKHNDASKAIKSITTVMDSLAIQSEVVDPNKNPNCKFTFEKQKAAQYTKERADDEKVNVRKAEMTQSKIANAIRMIRRAIVEGIRFD